MAVVKSTAPLPHLEAVTLDHPANSKVTSQFVDLTPELAEKYLGKNRGNRNIRQNKVRMYATDMRNGNWHTSGQAIQFDWNGNLIDGQHRCFAVIDSGVTIRTLVVKGLDPHAREVIDTGATRSASDALKFAGHTYDNPLVAAIARIALIRENGGFQTAFATTGLAFSNSDIVDWVARNDMVVNASVLARNTAKRIGIIPSAWGYALFEMEKIDAARAIEFAQSMSEFQTNGQGDPRLAMLNAFQSALHGRRRKPLVPECIYLAYRTWNGWVGGETLRSINPAGPTSSGAIIPKLQRPRKSAA